MNRKKIFKLGLLLFIIPLILGAVFYNYLPQEIAVHFDGNNIPDKYASKNFALFGIPGLLLLLYWLLYFVTDRDPKRYNQHEGTFNIILIFMPLLTVVTSAITIMVAIGLQVNTSLIMNVIISAIFIVIGNYLPKVKRNYTLGIKTPWTMDNDYVWEKTHHIGSKVFVLGGVISLINAMTINNELLFITDVALMVLLPILYSYLTYKKLGKSKN